LPPKDVDKVGHTSEGCKSVYDDKGTGWRIRIRRGRERGRERGRMMRRGRWRMQMM
jgi:hypothetical protein